MITNLAFLRLTDAHDGESVWINFNHVWKFTRGVDGGTIIYLVPDTGGEEWNRVIVKETPGEIAVRLAHEQHHDKTTVFGHVTHTCEIPQ